MRLGLLAHHPGPRFPASTRGSQVPAMHPDAIPLLPAVLPANREVFVRAPVRPVVALVRRVADVLMDALLLLAIILSIPLVILAVGMPIALVVEILRLIGRHL
jgi:hypothetical protein